MRLLFLLCFIFLGDAEGARILGVIPTTSYSHQVVFRPIWRALAARGHQVTVMTTDPMNDSSLANIKEIDLHSAYHLYNVTEAAEKRKWSVLGSLYEMIKMTERVVNYELEHPEVQDLLKNKNEHFDLLIVEYLFPTMMAFSWKFRCPFVGVISLDASSYMHEVMGNPVHPILYPDYQMPLVPPLNFYERVYVTVYGLAMEYYAKFVCYFIENGAKKYFGEDLPPFYEIYTNMSLLFLNTNPVFHTIRPLVPATIQIGGGLHIQPPKPLPEDLKRYLDAAKQGVIYFSLGSSIDSKTVEPAMLQTILEAFKSLPYKILWKFDKDIPEKSSNIKIVKWIPQQDVLRHKHIKLFITQAGLQSIEEAIWFHVPIIAMPIVNDQFTYAKIAERKGIGLVLNKDDLTAASLTEAITTVTTDPKFKSKVEEIAKLMTDQPMSGIEKAIWWIEYVIRHKGAQHLRSDIYNVPTYQHYLLDVMAFFVVLITVIWVIMIKITRCMVQRLSKRIKLKSN